MPNNPGSSVGYQRCPNRKLRKGYSLKSGRPSMLSFRTRIFCSVLAAALIASGIAVYYGRASFEQSQVDAARERLLRETTLSAAILDKTGANPEGLRELAAILQMPQERLSLLDNSGNVLADTAPGAQPVSKLDNHVREMYYKASDAFDRAVRVFRENNAQDALHMLRGDEEAVQSEVRIIQQIMESLSDPDSSLDPYQAMFVLPTPPLPLSRATLNVVFAISFPQRREIVFRWNVQEWFWRQGLHHPLCKCGRVFGPVPRPWPLRPCPSVPRG